MPPSFEETQDEDETQPPSQPLSPYQGNFVTLFYIFLNFNLANKFYFIFFTGRLLLL